MNPQLHAKMLGFIKAAGLLATKTLPELERLKQARSNADQARPATLQALREAGAVPVGAEKQASALLADHGQTQELLKQAVTNSAKLAARVRDLEQQLGKTKTASLGAGLAPSGSSWDSVNDNFPGRRTTPGGAKRESDRVFEQILNGG